MYSLQLTVSLGSGQQEYTLQFEKAPRFWHEVIEQFYKQADRTKNSLSITYATKNPFTGRYETSVLTDINGAVSEDLALPFVVQDFSLTPDELVIKGEDRAELIKKEAVRLMVAPVKQSAGADWAALREEMKKLLNQERVVAFIRETFNKNWTQLKTPEIEQVLAFANQEEEEQEEEVDNNSNVEKALAYIEENATDEQMLECVELIREALSGTSVSSNTKVQKEEPVRKEPTHRELLLMAVKESKRK